MKSAMWLVLVTAMVWGALWALSMVLQIAPGWPLWMVSVGVGLVVGVVGWLYRYEQQAVTPGRAKTLLALRLVALFVLIWIVLEPTWVRTEQLEIRREVVIVYDESASMDLIDDGQSETRIEIGRGAMLEAEVVEELGESAKVRSLRAARGIGEGQADSGWKQSTDLAGALATVLEQVPPDELAGVVMVTDGRHNRPGRVEDVARRFGILDAPIGVLAVGSENPPKDASILSVEAPEAVHLGDRMRVHASLKFDGYKGKKATVSLFRGDDLLEEKEVEIPQEHHREDVRFAQVPEGGLGDFRVEIGGLSGERFDDNNTWSFETSITDARTNVLLVDNHPRWEFRYLRNLFYGRDKSVHLQWALMNPDRIEGEERRRVPASAARPFGEAQATTLPVNEAEWRKFDVIILGDLAAESIDDETWQVINRCVSERGALLVMVAGPEHMPHALVSESGRALVPVEMSWGARTYYQWSGGSFRPQLTPTGLRHPVTQQETEKASNEEVWAEFPEMRWRHPMESLKEGAEVLLVGRGQTEESLDDVGGLASALDALSTRERREAEEALLVVRQTGEGKVALLLTDRTWRLREGSGDVYHHRFWGNLVRWGAGPVLRAGNSQVRLGTDQLTYTPDDVVLVRARLRDESMNPVEDESLVAEILRGTEVIQTLEMVGVEGSNGFYEGRASKMAEAGRYEVRLKGAALGGLTDAEVSTGIRVVGSRGPVELSDTSLNLPLLETMADLSGARVVRADQVEDLVGLFQRDAEEREEVRETPLWNHWVVLSVFFVLLASEWGLRRSSGLP